MYIGVDIGGTKTLVAALDDSGVIVERIRFQTTVSYQDFLHQLKKVADKFKELDFRAGCVAAPGKIDREHGIARDFGNLPWHDVEIQKDAEDIFRCPMVIENDANLGGLSESMLLPKDKLILYITISTGIGTGFINNQVIAPELADSEGGHMILDYHGRRVVWEKFASGKAIVKRFGKRAEEITDKMTWRRIAYDLAKGFIELIAIAQPDIIVIGGSVGCYFDRFKDFLIEDLHEYSSPLLKMPTIQQAARPDDAVLYGCYDLARGRYGPAA